MYSYPINGRGGKGKKNIKINCPSPGASWKYCEGNYDLSGALPFIIFFIGPLANLVIMKLHDLSVLFQPLFHNYIYKHEHPYQELNTNMESSFLMR